MIWWQAIVLIMVGVVQAMICCMAGAYLMFKAKSQPGSGESFLLDPKGDVFSIPDESDGSGFPGEAEPSKDEKNVLERTNRFLKSLGGEP
jgi:hypothetical protein